MRLLSLLEKGDHESSPCIHHLLLELCRITALGVLESSDLFEVATATNYQHQTAARAGLYDLTYLDAERRIVTTTLTHHPQISHTCSSHIKSRSLRSGTLVSREILVSLSNKGDFYK